MSSNLLGPPQAAGSASDASIDRALGAARSAENVPKKLVQAARQLEAVFVGMIFNEMAKTVDDENGLLPPTPGREMYEEWFRSEVAQQWSEAGGTGLGDTIATSLGADGATAEAIRGALKEAMPVTSVTPASSAPHASSIPGAFERSAAPVEGVVTSPFGPRVHPVTGEPGMHEGIDVAVPIGTPVRSPFAGTVESVTDDPHGGHRITIRHMAGYRSTYAHNSEVLVRQGDQVSAGQVISRSGNSGRSTGPHLHFELRQDGKPVDPSRWLKFRVR